MLWQQLQTHLAQRRVLNNDGQRIMLLLKYAGTDKEDAVGQRVEVSQAEIVGAPWVALWADVCALSEIELRRALVHNGTLAVGSITINEDYYFIRHAVPLQGLTVQHLDLLIDLVAHEAARLRARRPLAAVPDGPEATAAADRSLGHYAE